MAHVKKRGYKFPGKQKGNLEELVAHHAEVQRELKRLAEAVEGEAAATLAEHRDEGHAEIVLREGQRVDYYVDLDDTKSGNAAAAAAIEFGREAYVTKDGRRVPGTEGVHALTGGVEHAKRRHHIKKKPKEG